jgi:hypothetical protein
MKELLISIKQYISDDPEDYPDGQTFRKWQDIGEQIEEALLENNQQNDVDNLPENI